MTRILAVEDEVGVREMLVDALRRSGYRVREAGNVAEAWRELDDVRPDLVLLDWMLPDASGLEFLRKLRARDDALASVPVIMLTARGEEGDRIRGLDSGADDYVAKPFSPRELKARIRAVLRRAPDSATEAVIAQGGLVMDTDAHRVTADGVEVRLGATEFRLLHSFMTSPDRVLTRSQLLDRAWGQDAYIDERAVDVQVRRLRMALDACGKAHHLQTVRGVGYRFSVP